MIRVANTGCVRRLGFRSMRAARTRNIVAVLAIALRARLKSLDKREGKADNKGKQAGDEGECVNIQAISAGKSMRRYERI